MFASAHTKFMKRAQAIARSPLSGAALFMLIGVLALNTKFDVVDDSYYIELAKSLAGGFGFSDIFLPEPAFHQHFPPGLPLFLAVPTLFGFDLSTSVVLYKILLIGCGALGLYLFGRNVSAEGYASQLVASAVLIASVSIVLIGYSVRVASEFLYLLLSVASLTSLSKYERSPHRSRWGWISAILLVAAILTRSIGVTIMAAAVLSWGLRRDFRRLALLISWSAMFWLPWLLWSRASRTGVTSYLQEFLSFYRSDVLVNLGARVLENAWLIVNRDIPRIVLSFTASEFVMTKSWLNMLLLPVRVGISALVIFPLIRSLWPRPRIAPLYLLCYFLPVLIWKWDPGRYIVPVVPFVCLWFFVGLDRLLEKLTSWKQSLSEQRLVMVPAIVAICIASHLVSDGRFLLTVRQTGHYTAEAASIWNETMTAYQWIRQHTPQASIIGCEPAIHPHVHLFTDRKAVPLRSRAETYKQLGITHIIHITDPTMYQGREVNRRPDLSKFIARASGIVSLTLAYQSAHVSIFEMN